MPVIEPDGIWCDVRTENFPPGRPALFLDRDGTLIELVAYLADPEQVVLIDTMVETVRAANAAGDAVILVTNQSGIGRGYYDWAAFEAVQARLYELLEAEGSVLDAAYACPHPPPEANGPPDSAYRKPAPGMFLRAAEDLAIDLAKSRIIGDTHTDLSAGKAAGLVYGELVATGYGGRSEQIDRVRRLADPQFKVNI